MAVTAYRFNRRLADGSTYKLGTAVRYRAGWRFLSNVASHKNSRKFHATMEKCLPRWLDYPDGCESERVPQETTDVWTDPWARLAQDASKLQIP